MKGCLLKSVLLRIALCLSLSFLTPVAVALGSFTFPGADPAGDTNTPVITNLTLSPLERVNLLSESVNDLFRSKDWTTGAALNTAEYVQFTIQPAASHILSLTDLSFDVKRSLDKASPAEKDGPLNAQVQIFQGVSLTPKGSMDFSPTEAWQPIVFKFVEFTALNGETVTVRLYGWNAGHNNGWLDFDNLTINGSVSAVPEPSPVILFSCGLLMFIARCALRRCS